MVPVPWRYVNSWWCNGCGFCCKRFEVVLKFNEWLKIIQTHGIGVTGAGLNKFYLGKKPDGSCLFLCRSGGICLCGLQNMKPLACKLWPFRITDKPKYGKGREAFFNYRGRGLFVYIDPSCPKIMWGKPTEKMTNNVIPEFIEIALGLKVKQFYSTSMMLQSLYDDIKSTYETV